MKVAGHLDRLEERVEELERRQSEMEDYLGVEWYDVPMRERYVEKGGRKVWYCKGGE